MPKLLLLDFETTGIDPKTARPIQYWGTVYDTKTKEEFGQGGFLWAEDYPPLTKEIQELTGISEAQCKQQGMHPREFITRLGGSFCSLDFLVAHNARGYDSIILAEEAKRQGITLPEKPWIDTRYDIPYPGRTKCRVLSHLALEHDITFNRKDLHQAKGDVWLMLEILKKYDIDSIISQALEKKIVIQAKVSYDDRELAKARGFGWEKVNDKTYPKSWVKLIRESQLEHERKEAKFPILIRE